MVEIAKALLHKIRVLILDEPTASLTDAESEKLFALIERLTGQGIGVIYVSHRLGEIKRVADRVTVLRDGRRIGTVGAGQVSEADLVEMMTGRKVEVFFPKVKHRPDAEVLRTERLSLASGALENVSIRLRAGEIVGVAGLVGCGKGEARARDLRPRADRGREDPARRPSDRAARRPPACCARACATSPPTGSPRVSPWCARCARTHRWRRSICRRSRAAGSCGAAPSARRSAA